MTAACRAWVARVVAAGAPHLRHAVAVDGQQGEQLRCERREVRDHLEIAQPVGPGREPDPGGGAERDLLPLGDREVFRDVLHPHLGEERRVVDRLLSRLEGRRRFVDGSELGLRHPRADLFEPLAFLGGSAPRKRGVRRHGKPHPVGVVQQLVAHVASDEAGVGGLRPQGFERGVDVEGGEPVGAVQDRAETPHHEPQAVGKPTAG